MNQPHHRGYTILLMRKVRSECPFLRLRPTSKPLSRIDQRYKQLAMMMMAMSGLMGMIRTA